MGIAAMKRQITQMASDLQKLKASETMEIANKKVPAFVLHLSHHLIFIYIRVHSAIEALELGNCQLALFQLTAHHKASSLCLR